MALLNTISAKRNEILQLAAKHGASNVRIFGSVVRGEEDDNSDIDFLVSYPPGYDLFAQLDLIEDLTNMLNRKVDVIEERSLHRVIKDSVMQEAKQL